MTKSTGSPRETPLNHSGSAPSTAGFVREATDADLEAIGRVHAAAMLSSLRAAHASAHDAPLPAGVEAMVAPPVIAAGWEQAVSSPPSSAHRVLVAVGESGEVVGLVGVAPSPDDGANMKKTAGAADGHTVDAGAGAVPVASRGLEITALGVAPEWQRRGHGSRLLAAATEHAHAQGADVLLVWAVRGDESLAGFLRGAGLERTDSFRRLPVGQGVIEDCWVAAL
ncbi:Ribosomal protein S18 acetylase RimI [Actinomyces ruminicola]|uniref:Ribosomal protein S18 acetylase RimI n=1 Tax=Actinomyces ruminicola TaxID=332524 RepID=A0A1G9ZAX1_9ACTO|nr:GNAT family N-acetyltransferase [Actinomyces ruminicola]SDN18255.1 Ribosomal protein S18 acetylase RimI [Actinomyces ruminicola]